MSLNDLLPKDKFDDSNLERIRQLNNDELSEIIYDLFQWLQDCNWPISHKVLIILIERQDLVFPYISDVLKGDDCMWICWILDLLIPELHRDYQQDLKNDIEILAIKSIIS